MLNPKHSPGTAVVCCARRLRLDNVYEDSKLCVFCTQYFDTDFGEYFCYHRGAPPCPDFIGIKIVGIQLKAGLPDTHAGLMWDDRQDGVQGPCAAHGGQPRGQEPRPSCKTRTEFCIADSPYKQ